MSVSCGFFNSSNKDRLYDARQFSSIFDGIINDGVYMGYGGHFAVTAMTTPSLSVNLASGRAWFNHTWTLNDATMSMTFDSTTTGRCDAVVLQVDTTDAVRANKIYIKKGTEGSPTVKPAMVRENGVYEYPICYVTIPDTNVIAQSAIENKVGSSDMPFVTGIIDTINIDTLIAQWNGEWHDHIAEYEAWYSGFTTESQNEFEEWFQHLHNELDEHQAAHLQNQIDDLETHSQDLEKRKQNNEKFVTYTISANGWSNGVYSFESVYPSTLWDIVNILPNASTTNDMRSDWAACDCTGYEETNIIRAHGIVPTSDIVMTLVLRYKSPDAYTPEPTGN